MKRVLNFIVALAMIFTFTLSFSNPFVMNITAETAADIVNPFGYDSADKFVSECMLGRATDSDGSRLQFEQIAYKPVLWDYTYQNIAEAIIDDDNLLTTSVIWKNAGYCMNGEFVDLFTWKKVMYETLIMDWLTYQFDSDTYKSEFEKTSRKYAWKLTKYLMKKEKGTYENGIYENLEHWQKASVQEAAELFDDDFYAANETLGKAEKFNSVVSDIQTVASTGVDFYKRMIKVLAAKETCQSRIDFLAQVKAVTDDKDLIAAIDEVTANMDRSFEETAFREGGFTMLKTICDQAWGLITEKWEIPMLKEIKLGKAGLDWFFNTSDSTSKRLEVVILYIINADFTKAYQKIRDTDYMSNPNEKNALDFNNAYLCFVNYQAYASYITEQYIASVLLEGAGKTLNNMLFSNNINTYNDLKQMLDGNISTSKGWYNMVGKYYNLYNDVAAKNTDLSWLDEETEINKTLSFPVDSVEWGMDDIILQNDTAILSPSSPSDQQITYTSSDPSVVSYGINGAEVHKPGTAVVTAWWGLKNSLSATLNVTVVEGRGKDGICVDSENPDEPQKKPARGDTFKIGNLTYYVYNDNEVGVKDCDTDAAGEINIPKYVSYLGYSLKVTGIFSGAFEDCSLLTSVTIPDGVTNIGGYAFEDCSALTSVTIPDGVTSIKFATFRGCSSLTSVMIPDSVTSIESSAFEDCSALTSITIPDGVTNIGGYAFEDCSALTSVTIPDGVTSIGNEAFDGCSSLTSITIPDSVTSIGDRAFLGCSSLTSVTIPDGVTSIGYMAFWGCSSLTSITIPDSVTSIGDRAFAGCSSLTSITIPDSVTSIEECTFDDCSSLTSVTIPDSVTSIGDRAFNGCSSLTSITIPDLSLIHI